MSAAIDPRFAAAHYQDGRDLHHAPRFPEVSCSSCGESFGPGDEGFSHCADHAHLQATEA